MESCLGQVVMSVCEGKTQDSPYDRISVDKRGIERGCRSTPESNKRLNNTLCI